MFKNFHQGEIILVNKPAGWTSFDVANKIKYATKAKTGHAGTLDPLATGLMILCTGKFTNKLTELTGMDKGYEGIITLGATTPSYDSETAFDQTFDYSAISEKEIHEAVQKLMGTIQQIPPAFSAIKKDGKKAYLMARKGKELQLEPRTVEIKKFDIIKIEMPDIHFYVECSKGTYIRSLAFDLGKLLNNGAYLKNLHRVSIGNFHVKDAWEINALVEHIKAHPELTVKDNTQ